jgi:hypothetical protein
MKLKSLMIVTALSLTALTAQADSKVREVMPSATFSSMLDKGFLEQARFFLPSVLAFDEVKTTDGTKQREALKAEAAMESDTESTSLENIAMLMAGLGVIGFVAGRRRSG